MREVEEFNHAPGRFFTPRIPSGGELYREADLKCHTGYWWWTTTLIFWRR